VLPPSAMAFIGQDAGLTLFHALGKLLYNKRDAAGAPGPQSQPSQLSASEAMESLLLQHGQQAQQSSNACIHLVSDDERQEEGVMHGAVQDAPASSHWCALTLLLSLWAINHLQMA